MSTPNNDKAPMGLDVMAEPLALEGGGALDAPTPRLTTNTATEEAPSAFADPFAVGTGSWADSAMRMWSSSSIRRSGENGHDSTTSRRNRRSRTPTANRLKH